MPAPECAQELVLARSATRRDDLDAGHRHRRAQIVQQTPQVRPPA
jgi:hypothetical protein